MPDQRRFIRLLPLIIFGGIAIFLWVALYRNPREIPSPLINKAAPAFSAPDLQNQRQILTEDIFRGHTTLLNVFATWCVACRAEHSVWMEGRRDLNKTWLVGLNYKDDRQKTLKMLSQFGNPYHRVIEDSRGDISINFGVYGAPETFIINQRGIICYKFIGAISPADWRRTVLPEVKKCEKS